MADQFTEKRHQDSDNAINRQADNKASSALADDTASNEKRDGAQGLENVNSRDTLDKSKPEQGGIVNGKRVLSEDACYDKLGFTFPAWKKWWILSVIFIVQVSMNFNASVYGNAISGPEGGVGGMTQAFGISAQAARCGQMIFLIAYAFGSELWAPWSEELGRRPILQLSLFLVNIWQLPCALAPNLGSMLVGRALGGLSSAGGSVTLGMVADMWEADDQQNAVNFVVFSSVGGSVVGPIAGAFIQRYLNWRWIFWMQLIFGGAVQILHFFTVPETRVTVMMDKEARRRRKTGSDPDVYGPNEARTLKERFAIKEILTIWARPFIMFATEPIVLCLSLFSGFSDALIFTFLESYTPVYTQWGFGTVGIGLAFLPILIGYVIAYAVFAGFIARDRRLRARIPDEIQPESRLFGLLFTAPLLTLGLFSFAWTSTGPPLPWIAPMICSAAIGLANFAIYMATIDYMVAAYGPYAASATGGNALARDFLAGVAALYATPMYENIGPAGKHLPYASTILACLAFVFTIPIYVFYWKGPEIRRRSRFASELAVGREGNKGRRASGVSDAP